LVEEALDGVPMLISAKTGDGLERNVIDDILSFADSVGRRDEWHYTRQPRVLTFLPKGIKMPCIGANDEGAQDRLRGATFQAWICDEAVLHPKSFFWHAVGRVSAGDRRKFFTTNPDAPGHYFKVEIMDSNDLDVEVWNFNIRDNPTLDEGYIKNLYNLYIGVDRDRLLEGKWIADKENLVIPEFQDMQDKIVESMIMPAYCNKIVSMDIGFRDPTHILYGYYDFKGAKLIWQDESVLRKSNTSDIAKEIKRKESELWGRQEPYIRVCDTDLIVASELSINHGIIFTTTAKDNKDAQINSLRLSIQNETLVINPKCKQFINQLAAGCWNKNKTDFERSEELGHLDGIDTAIYGMRNSHSIFK